MCCPHWSSRASLSSWWPNTVTHLELKASPIRWTRRPTPHSLDPSDHTSHLKVLRFIFTPLAQQVLEWLHFVPQQHLGLTGLLRLSWFLLFVACCISGLPKAAVVNQNRLLTALAVLASNGVTASDVIYLNLPLYHTAGFIIGFIGSIETGETTEL